MVRQSWSKPHVLFAPSLPPHCTPTTSFLENFSACTHTCVPTPLAFFSTLLGTLSILAWFFAQLPQLYKNYHLKSTAGLSVFFLAEWCLGDLSNISGAILTKQATWQVLIGAYYCFVDFSLVGQWIWYEGLKHGRPLKRFWKKRSTSNGNNQGGGNMAQVVDGLDPEGLSGGQTLQKSDKVQARPTTGPREISFKTPNYGSFQSSKEQSMGTPSSRTIHRVQQHSIPSPSPKTILFMTLLLSLARASPLPKDVPLTTTTPTITIATSSPYQIGTFLSWTSTLLYLGSRLPQLIKNYSRRSTTGLSLSLFVAAFFGNFFYSTSMLLNPLAWDSYGPYGCHGWAGADGSDRYEWITGALPFWLGAAGVLFLDASVAMQFWWFDNEVSKGKDGEVILVVAAQVPEGCCDSDGTTPRNSGVGMGVGIIDKGKSRWQEVNGWMRGWKPSASGTSTPRPESPSVVVEDRDGLLVDRR